MELREQLQDALSAGYTLERELGGGGMSRVFLATERALDRKVVVKVLSPDLAAGLSAERFAREIRFAASLQQANVVPVLTAGEASGLPFYTMPYIAGLSLRERLERDARLDVVVAIGILRDIARALAYAHARGVVHRDIKPENVLLSGEAAVVSDFGIAKAISAARGDDEPGAIRTTFTMAGTVIGTPAYMSPEQVTGDPHIDHRADLYSFGCLAYEVLAGKPPFASGKAHELFAQHLQQQPTPISPLRPDCPPALARRHAVLGKKRREAPGVGAGYSPCARRHDLSGNRRSASRQSAVAATTICGSRGGNRARRCSGGGAGTRPDSAQSRCG